MPLYRQSIMGVAVLVFGLLFGCSNAGPSGPKGKPSGDSRVDKVSLKLDGTRLILRNDSGRDLPLYERDDTQTLVQIVYGDKSESTSRLDLPPPVRSVWKAGDETEIVPTAGKTVKQVRLRILLISGGPRPDSFTRVWDF